MKNLSEKKSLFLAIFSSFMIVCCSKESGLHTPSGSETYISSEKEKSSDAQVKINSEDSSSHTVEEKNEVHYDGDFPNFFSICSNPDLDENDDLKKNTVIILTQHLVGLNGTCLEASDSLNNSQVLQLNNLGILDASPLGEFGHLTSLSISDNYVEDGSPLTELVNLKILAIGGNHFESYNFLENLANLKELDLSSSTKDYSNLFLRNLDVILKMKNIERIRISHKLDELDVVKSIIEQRADIKIIYVD